MLLGALLAPCNVYSGLKIGWSFNMSIAALLIGLLFWVPVARVFQLPRWGLLESNISQTTASSAASIISGGLVAPLPALALLTGENLPWRELIAWVFAVSFLGIWLGWYLRGRFIVESRLAFPAGMATAETMKDIFSHGREAAQRVVALLASLVGAVAMNAVDKLVFAIPRWSPSVTAKNLTFFVDPSLLLLGFGSIIGLRAGFGLLAGAAIGWGVLAPNLISESIVIVDNADWFQPLVGWLLWPGVTLMVTSSVVNLGLAVFAPTGDVETAGTIGSEETHADRRLIGLLIAAVLVVSLQIILFDIHWSMALLAIPLSLILATVAARVAGETGIPPIGAIGKVSQLSFGVLAPYQPVTNLMTANVAGGAAGQAADLLNDLKAGHLVNASPPLQIIAQCFGVLTGSIVGSLVYLSLIDNPRQQLMTPDWPAPAVATWKAVAETLSNGLDSIPASALVAMLVAGLLGIALALAERFLPARMRNFVPSSAALGLAFVVPASTSLTLFVGALLGAVLSRIAPVWSSRFLLSIAAGLVAGESLFGVAAVWF